MIATKTKQAAFRTVYDSIASELRTRMQNATVRLRAGTSSRFTGSGVILAANANYTFVVTALHNVYKLADMPDPPPDGYEDLLTAFRTGVTIVYGNDAGMDIGREPTKTAAISHLTDINLGQDPMWSYDVLLLRSEDADLKRYAGANAIYGTGRPLPTPSTRRPKPVALDAAQYLGYGVRGTGGRGDKVNFLIQMGYGAHRDPETLVDGQSPDLPADSDDQGTNAKGKLQFRMVTPKVRAVASVYDRDEADPSKYHEFWYAIQVDADANDSTAPGDSGGPLFVASFVTADSKYVLDLIGVTTGADMPTRAGPYPPTGTVRANNISTSLEQFYESAGREGVRDWRPRPTRPRETAE
jgi:hypothetical protein